MAGLEDALTRGLVVEIPSATGRGSLALTSAGEAWMRDMPPDMLRCIPERGRRMA